VSQKPFDGKLDYDFLFWIDSDVLFSTEDVLRLLNHDVDIVSGCYIMHDNTHYPIVETMDHEYFMGKGHYDFVTRPRLEELRASGELVPIDYVGFGFMCVKKGVFESLTYPYFAPRRIDFDRPNVVEFASEDVSFCMNARDAGYKVLLDPAVVVAHQKLIPLR
jgi:GT2 family glycosyltransferase